jgi:type VI protein secretion system component VasK
VKGAVDKKAKTSKGAGQLEQILGDRSSLTTADVVVKVFQPASYTTPAELDQLVSDHNQGYIGGLRMLQGKMDMLAHASTTAEKTAAMADAGTAQGQAHNALKQMADKFQNFRREGLDGVLEHLLEEPIGLADALLVQKSPAITKNGELLSQVCLPMKPILMKYPFNQTAKEEAKSEVSPAELEAWFAPNVGKLWKYATGSGADLVVLHAGKWEQNPMSQDMKAAPELLNFLNGAQQLTKAFFSKGGTEPGFTYALRPTAGQTGTIQLKLDGTEMDKVFQTTFSWPAASGKSIADGMVFTPNGSSHGFGQYPGLWAVFRLFEAAAPREPNAKEVQWNQVRGNGGLLQSFSPAVKVDIVAFPGGVDVFQPRFFEGLAQCPKKAAATN